jgi:hypothetical protein
MTISGLPHDPLTPLDPTTKPSPAAVRQLRQQIYNNALSMQTSYGGGKHGHLGMLMPHDRYTALSQTPYYLTDSAPKFVDPTEQATAQQVWWKPWTWTHSSSTSAKLYNDAKLKFDKATTEWEAAQEFKRTMRKLLIQAIPAMYLTTFHSSEYGYADMEPGAVIEQLLIRYGTITRKEMAAHLAKLELPWNPDLPIETVFTNAEECQKFATDGDDPISKGRYLEALEKTFRNSGVLEQAVYAWETTPEEDQTLVYMREHFTKADEVRRSKRDPLRGELTANAAEANAAEAAAVTPSPKKALLYCWSHGLTNHTSADCKWPVPGHNNKATIDNWAEYGGNNTMVFPRGRKQIFQDAEQRPTKRQKREEENAKRKTKGEAKALAALVVEALKKEK